MSSTPAPYALILIDLAVEAGVPRGELLKGSGLAQQGLAAVGARVADADFQILVANARRMTADPALGLRLGQRLNLSAHAVLGQAFMTCRNLAEVMQLFQRYYPMLAQDLDLEFRIEDTRVTIVPQNFLSDLPLAFGLECMAAAMRNTLSGLLRNSEFPLRCEFPYPAPSYLPVYRETLGDDLHFDRPSASWSFPRGLLEQPLPSSNPALRELYESECARLLADLQDSTDLRSRSYQLLRKFEGQYPKMPQLAKMLNLSPRTYRRRLATEGTAFQEVLDAVRAEHATRHLRNSSLPIASIAYRLGFSDPSNFRRAYRRWTGKSPGTVRRLAQQG